MGRFLFLFVIFLSIVFYTTEPFTLNQLLEGISNFLYNLLHLVPGIIRFALEARKFASRELEDTDVSNNSVYDFIVIGAGSAGSVVASRLSEVNATVLLIEAGGPESKWHNIPLLAFALQLFDVNWAFATETSEKYCRGLKDNSCRLARGKVMGGTSTINAMVATRGNKADYDEWAALGNDGWSYQDLLPYFKKLESARSFDSGVRGHTGPVTIKQSVHRSRLADAFVKAGLEQKYPSGDYNGHSQNGYFFVQSNIADGERVSSNKAYLHPAKGRENLVATKRSLVSKINIDPETKTTSGVTFIKDGKVIAVKANREVILSAGALQSPHLLMLSGIGPAQHLQDFGITVVKDAPGVGKNLMDHVGYGGLIFLTNTTDTLILPHLIFPWRTEIAEYFHRRTGIFSSPCAIGALSFINTLDKSSNVSDIEILYGDTGFLVDSVFTKSILGFRPEIYDNSYSKYSNVNAYSTAIILMKPKSRGEILLKSNDIYDAPKFIVNYYEDPEDIATMIRGIKATLALVKTHALQEFGSNLIPELVHGCEDYDENSDDYWECALRTLTLTIWHYCGTVKMGPKSDPMAVVDNRLKVYGIKNLRVVDASIMPNIITGHTNIPTIMIGEKASDMIKEDWNLVNPG